MLSSFRKIKVQVFFCNAWSALATLACLYCSDLFLTKATGLNLFYTAGALFEFSVCLICLSFNTFELLNFCLWCMMCECFIGVIVQYNQVFILTNFPRGFCFKTYLSRIFFFIASADQLGRDLQCRTLCIQSWLCFLFIHLHKFIILELLWCNCFYTVMLLFQWW